MSVALEIPELVNDDDDEMEIVVHTIQRGKIPSMKKHSYGEFYTVNLKTNIISKCVIGKLIKDDDTTSMVALDNSIYILGGYIYKTGRVSKTNAIAAKVADHHFHSKASTIDMVDKKDGWKAIPRFRSLHPSPNALSFNGKIYLLGGNNTDPDSNPTYGLLACGEVFDPKTGKWDLLLPPPSPSDDDDDDDVVYWGYYVSSPSLADLDNKRIIVHFSHNYSIYAYYPDESRWECLVSRFGTWHPLVVLHDGLLVFHDPDYPACFMAFDLNARRYLKPVISNFDPSLLFSVYVCLFPLKPPGTFCFVSDTTEIDNPVTELGFVKFKVERIPQSEDPLIIFISCQHFDIDCKCDISNCVPLEPVLNPLFKTAATELGTSTTTTRMRDT